MKTSPNKIQVRARARGFTLAETAISLVLLALATGTVVTILQQQITQHKMAETDAILASARDALLSYETTYGYLPCPATAATNGQEAVTIAAGTRTASPAPVKVSESCPKVVTCSKAWLRRWYSR